MGNKPKDITAKTFDVRLSVRGENAVVLQRFIQNKMKTENRKKITDAVEAVLLEVAKEKGYS